LHPAWGWLALALGCSLLACGARQQSPDPQLPNVVLIVADDLGWLDLSVYGNPNLGTPHIDRLAREGVRFTRAFVAAPSCSSSRASIMTGQYPHTNGVTGLAHLHLGATLSPFRDTLADLLAATGYETGLAGKWHVAPYLPAGWYGYDERMGRVVDPWIREMDPILDFIARHRERPFYLEINFMNTHRDDAGEFEFDPAFPVNPDAVQILDYLQLPDWPEIRLELAKFYSQAMGMDARIGEVLGTLDRLGLVENTIVLFVSDNGPPFPGSKMTVYDRGIATPLIVRWPARVPAGGVRTALVSTIDILPTILEATGREVPEWVQGRSFLSLLAQGAPDTHRPRGLHPDACGADRALQVHPQLLRHRDRARSATPHGVGAPPVRPARPALDATASTRGALRSIRRPGRAEESRRRSESPTDSRRAAGASRCAHEADRRPVPRCPVRPRSRSPRLRAR
jgi:arylsulfatase A-like enzyme